MLGYTLSRGGTMMTFKDLINLKEILELAKKNLEFQMRSPLYVHYFNDYTNSQRIFLVLGKQFYKNTELTIPELNEYYLKDYQEYMGRRL